MMFEKVTDKYECKGEAQYYMPLSPEEHAEAVLSLIEEREAEATQITVDTVNGQQFFWGSTPVLRRLLLIDSPRVNRVVFDTVCRGVPIRTTLDYQRKNIILNVHEELNRNEKHILTEYFAHIMGVKCDSVTDEYMQFQRLLKITTTFAAVLLSLFFPMLGFVWWIGAVVVVAVPRVSWRLYEKFREMRR